MQYLPWKANPRKFAGESSVVPGIDSRMNSAISTPLK